MGRSSQDHPDSYHAHFFLAADSEKLFYFFFLKTEKTQTTLLFVEIRKHL